ncbi:Crp/Fnr family transcriptional regulator [Profundibacter sp.]|uniref:Crp/Fnr family transcriptional regulator n=1 Tax=Profundibacter sp. TaxID=3101071 RepID=UPI003D10601B
MTKGEALFREGQRVTGIYYVISGEVKALRHTSASDEAVMVRAKAGELFAESAIAAPRYTCDAMAVKPSELLFLANEDLDQALSDSEFTKALFLANAANARRQCSRYERVRLRSARDRVLHLLACESGPDGIFHWPAPLTELAVELALEPETLYRVLRELETANEIIRDKRSFRRIS